MRPRHGPWVTSISTLSWLVQQDLGVDHVGDGESIVHWGVVMPIDLQMEPPVEGVEIGDDRDRRGPCSAARRPLGAEHRAMGDVEADHRHVGVGLKTRLAASGSTQMLNSALGVTLPRPIAPPMTTMPSIRSTSSGYIASSSAMFVSGPTGISVCGRSRSLRAISSTAWIGSGLA